MSDITHTSPAPLRIVVAGGGIAGAEVALTLSMGLRDVDVTLVGQWPSVRILPDLVYVPFHVAPRRVDVPLSSLLPFGVSSIEAGIERVDVESKRLVTSVGDVHYDVLVAAPGCLPRGWSNRSLRSLRDALRIQGELERVVHAAQAGERRTITIRAESDDSWTAPACEFALLLGTWIRAQRLEHRVETLYVTGDSSAFEWFGPEGEQVVTDAMRRNDIHVATSVPFGRFDALDGDMVVDFGSLSPRVIDGLPGRGASGWYETDSHMQVAPDTFVVGDAVNSPYRTGFATAWEARRVLAALGGDVERIGHRIDGIPHEAVEYQMDLGDGVMRARIAHAETLAHPFLGHDADIEVVAEGRPDKLKGLLLHDRVLRHEIGTYDAALAFRDLLRAIERGVATPQQTGVGANSVTRP